MPGWHQATKQLVREKKLIVLGITQEQHPNRCQLFAQWQQFDWPILHDPINLMENKAVPIAVFIDESGIVRGMPRSAKQLDTFLRAKSETDAEKRIAVSSKRKLDELKSIANSKNDLKSWRNYGDGLVLWADRSRISNSIAAYQKALKFDPNNGRTQFRLGVAYRMRFDSKLREPADFEFAIKHWNKALELDPSQYIWRRRIQQYGPRLDKPYPFYDWVAKAKAEISNRGDEPTKLLVKLSGAEIAQRIRKFEAAETVLKHPDPDSKIPKDESQLVSLRIVKVGHTSSKVNAARIHLEFRPNSNTHWNNESEPLMIWIENANGWKSSKQILRIPSPEKPETNEVRQLEFEIRAESQKPANSIRGFALFNVCEETGGQCLFLRKDFEIKVE